MQNGKIKKTLKPSQRDSITDFSSRYNSGLTFEDRHKIKKILTGIVIAICIILLIYIGFFFTDLFIKFSLIPADEANINPEAIVQWISYPIIQD